MKVSDAKCFNKPNCSVVVIFSQFRQYIFISSIKLPHKITFCRLHFTLSRLKLKINLSRDQHFWAHHGIHRRKKKIHNHMRCCHTSINFYTGTHPSTISVMTFSHSKKKMPTLTILNSSVNLVIMFSIHSSVGIV